MTDSELVSQLARGEQTAFQVLYERHWKPVYRFAWLLAKSVADAEDITQDCFLTLARKASSFDPTRAQLRTWLIAVARNLYLQRLGSSMRLEEMHGQEAMGAIVSLDERLIQFERENAVRLALSRLPVAQREVLFLFEFEELSMIEIAAVLKIEPNAVKGRLYRARQALKSALATSGCVFEVQK
jgi:RNA polymerase sigma-70 factor (ECF subfamily)